jgi:hypothetical protein
MEDFNLDDLVDWLCLLDTQCVCLGVNGGVPKSDCRRCEGTGFYNREAREKIKKLIRSLIA